jgi:hypothetical protein
MHGVIHLLPQYACRAWCLVKAEGQFYLYLRHIDMMILTGFKHLWIHFIFINYSSNENEPYLVDRKLTDFNERTCTTESVCYYHHQYLNLFQYSDPILSVAKS